MTETFEYGYLHLLGAERLVEDQAGFRWVGIVEAGAGLEVHGEGESALTILNRLGQDGWMIADTVRQEVKSNNIPNLWTQILLAKYKRLGVIRSRQRAS